MLKRVISGMLLTMLLTGVLILTLGVRPVNSWEGGPIYLRADGSIDPSNAPVQRLGDTYTLTDDISVTAYMSHGIVVERNNILLDGAGCSLYDSGAFNGGIYLSGRSNVTIRNIRISGFTEGIMLEYSSNIVICKNNVSGCGDHGILVKWSSAIIFGNNVFNNAVGINLHDSSNCLVYHNSFTDNDKWGYQAQDWSAYNNAWDNGCEGNYWNDYDGVDSDGDGIGDTPYDIPGGSNSQDHYPLMSQFILGDINHDGVVDIFDAVTLSAAAGSRPGDDDWNPHADLNEDGIIDIFDGVILAANV